MATNKTNFKVETFPIEYEGLKFVIIRCDSVRAGIKMNILFPELDFIDIASLKLKNDSIDVFKDSSGSTYPYLLKHLDYSDTEGYGESVPLNKENSKKFKEEIMPILERWYHDNGRERIEEIYEFEIW